MSARRHRFALLIAIATFGAVCPASADEPVAQPCKSDLAEGLLELRRARYDEARTLLRKAQSGSPACVVEADLGLADLFNSVNQRKAALAAAGRVLAATEDRELLARAQLEIARAEHQTGRRMNDRKRAAEAAYLRAIELSEGDLDAAVQGLARLYDQTEREAELAALRESHPDVAFLTHDERMDLLRAHRRPTRESAEAVDEVDIGEGDCDVKDSLTDEERERLDGHLPGDDGEIPLCRSEGLTRPKKVDYVQPAYPDALREELRCGVVVVRAVLGAEGKLDSFRVLVTPDLEFSKATLQALRQWTFEPARDADGDAVACYYDLTAVFRIQ